MTSKARTLHFISPKKIEVREAALPSLSEDDVLVETTRSVISAGTEMLVYRGQFPHIADMHDGVSSEMNYPLAYGYACVGRVVDIGKAVNGKWLGKLVFAFHPHSSSFIIHPSTLIPIPESLSDENACFLPNMETAVNLVQDGAPILGERVLIFGQGVVGLLTTSLLSEFPLEKLATADLYKLRRNASSEISGVTSFDSNILNFKSAPHVYTQEKFDLTFELSGSPAALNDAIEFTTFSGRIIVGSWYGEKRAEIELGGTFHRSRIRLVSSQVSTISPELSGRWDKTRRFDVAWKALERIKPEKWITHRFPFEEADKAYQLLDENPQETLQVIFEYGKS